MPATAAWWFVDHGFGITNLVRAPFRVSRRSSGARVQARAKLVGLHGHKRAALDRSARPTTKFRMNNAPPSIPWRYMKSTPAAGGPGFPESRLPCNFPAAGTWAPPVFLLATVFLRTPEFFPSCFFLDAALSWGARSVFLGVPGLLW